MQVTIPPACLTTTFQFFPHIEQIYLNLQYSVSININRQNQIKSYKLFFKLLYAFTQTTKPQPNQFI